MTVRINDKPWREIVTLVRQVDSRKVQVGVFEGKVARVAQIHEFGAPRAGIPERSFIRRTFQERRDDLHKLQVRIARLLLDRKIGATKAMGLLGTFLVSAVRKTILDQPNAWPLLAPATVRRKARSGKSKILINTGQLIASIAHRIVGR